MKPVITISAHRVLQFLVCVVFFLSIAGFAAMLIKYILAPDQFMGDQFFTRLFCLDQESNIPTWFASSTLLLCSLLLGAIATRAGQAGESFRHHWAVLSVIFLYLSIDEAATLHEALIFLTRSALRAGGFLYHTWVIPGAVLILLFLLVYWKFILSLPSSTRGLFLLAGAIYVGGGLGAEFFAGWYFDFYGTDLTYAIIRTLEEVLEMVGIVIFVYALVSYMSSGTGELRIRLGSDENNLATDGQ